MRLLTPYLTSRNLSHDLFDEMDHFFDRWSQNTPANVYQDKALSPVSEISETEDYYLMSMDVPGMKKEDIKIELVDNMLTISGERKREKSTDENQKFQRYEKSYGVFKRSFTLPSSVESDKVEARYENGVLELILPKVPAAKPRQIAIQANKSGLFERLVGAKKESEQ